MIAHVPMLTVASRRRFAAALPSRFSRLAAVLIVLASIGGSARADDKKTRTRAPKVVQLEEIKIEGRVQKPNAFYILNRSNIGYEVLDLRTSFVQEIVRSVRHEPF